MFLALALATQLPAQAADPSADDMIRALSPRPQAPLTRGLGRSAGPRASDEGRLELSVQFDLASAALRPEGRALLGQLATAMQAPALADRHFRIEGHTDATGSVAGNLRLSVRRADAVVQFLRTAGVDPARLSAQGLGSARLADREHPESGVNRRVVILSLDGRQMQAAGAGSAATVQRLGGELQVQRGDEKLVVQPGARLREGDVLTTGPGGTALARLDDGSQLVVRSDTRLRIGKLRLGGDVSSWVQSFDLLSGAVRYVSGALGKLRPQGVQVVTMTATVGLRGTDLDVVFVPADAGGAESGTYVRVNDGAVALAARDGSSVDLRKDEQAFAGPPQPATRGVKPRPAAMRLTAGAAVFRTSEMDALLEK